MTNSMGPLCPKTEFFKQILFMEKFSCPNTNFGPIHEQGDSLAYQILITILYLI